MNTKPNTTIDLVAVRNEIAATHEQAVRWERSLDQPPTTTAHWTKLAELAGPHLKEAMRAGIVHIEIPAEAASGSGLGKPRFVVEDEPALDREEEQ